MNPHFTLKLAFILQADVTAEQISNLLEATGNTEVEPFYPIIFANYLGDPEKLKQIIAVPTAAGGGGGAGGGGSAAAGGEAEEEEKEEEKEEEVEMDLGGGMDMFGGDEGGGDY